MFNKKLKSDVKEIKRTLVGHEFMGYSFKNPNEYDSLIGRVRKNEKEIKHLREVINLLMDKLDYSLAYHPPKDEKFEIVDKERK